MLIHIPIIAHHEYYVAKNCRIITVQNIILITVHLRVLSYKEKEKLKNIIKDLVLSINISQIQEFSEDKSYKQTRSKTFQCFKDAFLK